MMPKVSVIVPCYNIAPWLPRCLDSLINQTLTDIEIICVDDKSTDGTLEILQNYAACDKRIKLIKLKKNQGVSVARNTGIDTACGQYIGFVDPDDYVDADYYEKLYNAAKESDADIVKARLATITTDDEIEVSHFPISNKYDFYTEFSTAIYRRQMLVKNNIIFPIGLSLGEDRVFLAKAVLFCKIFVSLSDTNYWYIHRPGSADSASRYLSQETVYKCMKCYQDLLKWAKIHHASYINTAYIYLQTFNLVCYIFPKTSNPKQSGIAESLLNIYRNSPDKSMIDNKISFKLQKALQNNDVKKIYSILSSKNKRLRIFGFIPLLKITKHGESQTDYMLLDFIPIVCIKKKLNLTKYYVFKVLLMKVKG